MTTITTIAADSWSISIGGGWILLMLIGMGVCLVFMLGPMRLMRDGRWWAICGRRWLQAAPPTDVLAGDSGPGQPDRTESPGSEGRP